MAQQSFLAKARPLVLARMATAVMSFAIPLVLARKLTLPEYGTYKQLFLAALTLYYVIPFGVPQALYFFIPRAERTRPYFGQTIAFLSVAGALGGILVAAATGPLSHYFSNPELLEYRWQLGAYVAFLISASTLEPSLTTRGRTGQAAVAYLVFDGLRAVALVVPALLGYGLPGTMTAIVFFAALRSVAAWALVLRAKGGPLFERGRLREQLAYAAPFGASVLIAIPQQYAHQYAVSAMVPPALFAIYAAGCFQLPLVDLLYTPTSEVLMVQIGQLDSEGRGAEAAAAFQTAMSKLALAFLPLSAFLFATAPEFIALAFGPKFMAAVPLFRVSLVPVVLAIFPVDGLLRARNDTRHIFRVSLAKAALTIPFVYFGVTRFGMMGGIVSFVSAEALGKALLMWRLPRALGTQGRRLGFPELLPWRALAKPAGAALSAALAVYAVRRAGADLWALLGPGFFQRLIPMAVLGTLFAAAYVFLLRAAGMRLSLADLGLRRRFS